MKKKNLLFLLLNILLYIYFGNFSIIFLTITGTLIYFLGKVVAIKKNKLVLILGLLFCLIPLLTFKILNYYNSSILLPLGISYYSLQLISYILDIYKGKIKVSNNIIDFFMFLYFTPCLFIGPINRYEDLSNQLTNNIKFISSNVYTGLFRITIGLFKKYVIANSLLIIISTISGNIDIYVGSYVLLALFLYSIELYTDFSGGIDMVIGLAKIFNINLNENFNIPFISQSIKEFWRRWHITLSSWLKDYVYIPLGGNRCSKLKNAFNLIFTFVVSGLWHGVNYIVWGLLHGILVIVNFKTKYKYLNIVITYILVSLLWIFFIYPNTAISLKMLATIFTNFNILNLMSNILNLGLNIFEIIIVCISIILLIIYDLNIDNIYIKYQNLSYDIKIIIMLTLILFIIVFGVYGFEFNGSDFIYSRF